MVLKFCSITTWPLFSIQISCGATVHLPWNIVGGYTSDCTIKDLYDFWTFPEKLVEFKVTASIGRSKVDNFDSISISSPVSEGAAGNWLFFFLVPFISHYFVFI